MKKDEEKEAEKKALELIARAEQCGAGLARKLEKRGFDAQCISAVISRLCETGLLDDSRYARLWLESRLRLTRSPRQLLASLCGRGIDRDIAEAALKNVLDEETEWSLINRFTNKHLKKISRKKNKESSPPLKFLLRYEGFSTQLIQRFIEEE